MTFAKLERGPSLWYAWALSADERVETSKAKAGINKVTARAACHVSVVILSAVTSYVLDLILSCEMLTKMQEQCNIGQEAIQQVIKDIDYSEQENCRVYLILKEHCL